MEKQASDLQTDDEMVNFLNVRRSKMNEETRINIDFLMVRIAVNRDWVPLLASAPSNIFFQKLDPQRLSSAPNNVLLSIM